MQPRILLLALLLGLLAVSAKEAERPLRLPQGSVVVEERFSQESGWKQNCRIDRPVEASRKLIAQCLASQHWKLDQSIPLDAKAGRTLMQWSKGRRRILVMVWKINGARTGFSWGEIA